MVTAVQQCRHAATRNAFSAATPERIVAAKRFMGELDKLYKVCFSGCHVTFPLAFQTQHPLLTWT